MYVDRLSTGITAQSQPAKQPPDKGGLLEVEAAREANLLLGGSDGETSDYQRSTPSPRDSETSEGEYYLFIKNVCSSTSHKKILVKFFLAHSFIN